MQENTYHVHDKHSVVTLAQPAAKRPPLSPMGGVSTTRMTGGKGSAVRYYLTRPDGGREGPFMGVLDKEKGGYVAPPEYHARAAELAGQAMATPTTPKGTTKPTAPRPSPEQVRAAQQSKAQAMRKKALTDAVAKISKSPGRSS